MNYFVNAHHYAATALFLSLILAGNIPVGFHRKRFARFSRPWARCIYIPILANIVLRRFLGLGYSIIPFTIMVVLAGQLIGARIRKGDTNNQYGERGSISG
ncbi:MAG: hypothetical protein HY266_03640 [Deltaproteobacteria bacterium]|nr:hypothetical protein [Deltaproteobacteria bacterium]